MANWDQDSPQLRTTLTLVLNKIRISALKREVPRVAIMRAWQAETMSGLEVPDSNYIGHFRGEPGLENTGVRIGDFYGSPAVEVKRQVDIFEKHLHAEVANLDASYPDSASLDGNGLVAVIHLSAWAHIVSGSVFIHSPTETAVLPGCGPTSCSCATAFRPWCSYVHVQVANTRSLALKA